MLNAILIDVINDKYEVVDVEGKEAKELAKLCGCNYVEEVVKQIGGKTYSILCDEDGLFKKEQKPSALDKDNKVLLVGNLLILNHGDLESEDFIGLTDVDIASIEGHIDRAPFMVNGKRRHWTVIRCK